MTSGLRRLAMRLRTDHPHDPTTLASLLRRRSLDVVDRLPAVARRTSSIRPPNTTRRRSAAHPPSSIIGPLRARAARLVSRLPIASRWSWRDIRVGRLATRERAVPVVVASLVLVASVLSVAPAAGHPATGNTAAAGGTPRLVLGGGLLDTLPESAPLASDGPVTLTGNPAVLAAESGADAALPGGQYLADGTLLKPIAVDPTVPDASSRLITYRVQSGDTLTGIAHRFGISMMTLWWANDLSSKDALTVGQQLVIPPVDGLVVTVGSGDTLDSIASDTGVDAATIASYNGLADDRVVVGETLIVPDALGSPIATPKPTPRPTPRPVSRTTQRSVIAAPKVTYNGAKFYFPLPGHAISQYFHYGHPGIDIAGRTGDLVHAAATGTVIYAGWRNNGGGYVVWVSHGSGIYTTYNHLSAVLVGTGQHVSRGQVVGRVGMTGWATGPHLHFEVWRGGVPGGVDRRVNPLPYF